MKIYKKTILYTIVVCFVSLSLSIILEFKPCIKSILIIINHVDFFKNLFLGIFASGLLVLIPAIVSYVSNKKQYYITFYQTSNSIFVSALTIITFMEEYCQDKIQLNNDFDNISLKFNELTSSYSNFDYFFKMNKKDKLIESILLELMRYLLFQDKLLSLSKELKIGKISEDEYKEFFDGIRKEMMETYREEFLKYRKMIDEDMRSIIKDRVLKKYY